MKDTSYLVDDDIAFGEMMRQNSMIAEAESSELAFDTGGDRKLQRFNWCPNSCNPLNGGGRTSGHTLTIDYGAFIGMCVWLTCNCNADYTCRTGVGCTFCCGNSCWNINTSSIGSIALCCRIDGVNLFSTSCFNTQLCGS